MSKTEICIYGAALVALVFVASTAFADSNQQQINGAGNTQTIIDGNGNNSPVIGSNLGPNAGGTINNTPVGLGGNGGDAKAYGGHAEATGGTGVGVGTGGKGTASVKDVKTGNQEMTVDVEGDQAQKRNPVSTAFASPLVAADDTCMGSSSAGGQAVGFGLSVGSTWKDGDCVRRKDARELHNMGQKRAALALMCQNPDVAAAMRTAGTKCPGEPEQVASFAPAAGTVAENKASDGVIYEYPTAGRRW